MKFILVGITSFILGMAMGDAKAQVLPTVSGQSNVYEIFPTEIWHYGETGAVEGDVCIFSNLFNNGFVLQILEKDEVIRAFVIDFGQAIFEAGRFYPFILSVNGKPTEVRGVAVTRSSIRFNLTVPIDTKEFEAYATNNIKAKTEDNDFVFFLNGLSDAFKSINGCSIDKDKTPYADQKFVEDESLKDNAKAEDIEEVSVQEVSKVEAKEPKDPVEMSDTKTRDNAPDKPKSADMKMAEHTSVKAQSNDDALESMMEKGSEVATLPITNSNRPAPLPKIPEMEDDEIMKMVKMLEAQKSDRVSVEAETPKDETLFDKQAKMFKEGQSISRDDAMKMLGQSSGEENTEELSQQAALEKREAAMSDQFKWQAKKGERLSDVLARWADQSGVKIKWQADDDPKLNANIATDLPFEQAVSVLMESLRQGGGESFYASLKQDATDVSLAKQDRVGDWRALLGMDLESVLENWSEKAQVELVWQLETPYRVQKEYRERASYAEAVSELLGQYKDLKKRPVAQLNVDPATGQLALIVKAQ